MKYLFYISLLSILTFSCQDDDDAVPVFCEEEICDFDCIETVDESVWTNACQDNYTCTFSVFDNSTIDLNENNGLKAGNNRVFQFITSTEGSPNIADDEFTNILVFELDNSQESFSVTDEALENINLYFRRVCFCAETDFIRINSGCLQGKLLASGQWAIQGNLEAAYNFGMFPVVFEANFE